MISLRISSELDWGCRSRKRVIFSPDSRRKFSPPVADCLTPPVGLDRSERIPAVALMYIYPFFSPSLFIIYTLYYTVGCSCYSVNAIDELEREGNWVTFSLCFHTTGGVGF